MRDFETLQIWYKYYSEKRVSLLKKLVKQGDKITRTKCGGGVGTFIFDHWQGQSMCNKSSTIDDCHPVSVVKINGKHLI